MTEKRFTVDGLTITENSPKGRKYLLEYQGGVNALCNRINGLFNKSKRLKKDNNELKYKYNEQSNEKMGLEEDIDRLLKENKELKEELQEQEQRKWACLKEAHRLHLENEQLKSDNFNLNKSVECLDETVKEQCNKIDWADECGVRWEEGYTKWIGDL